jgi:RNA polymerase sigma-70 factor, ECF subfamily
MPVMPPPSGIRRKRLRNRANFSRRGALISVTVPQPQSSPADLPIDLSAELHRSSAAEKYGLSQPEFAAILASIAAKHAPGKPAAACADLLRGLKLEELALARGCAAGNEHAWEVFLTRYREKLYDAARAITKQDSSARELADSIYADLYGTGERDGVRVSKLSFYTGRGSLEGWLRTVLAQEWVNRYRKGKRLVSLDEESEAGAQFAAPETNHSAPVPEQMVVAIDAALAALNPDDRYILASYYLDKRTLAEIGKLLGVHESTISRKVERLATNLRKDILDRLGKMGMSRRQAEEALDVDVRDVQVDIRARLQARAGEGLSRSGLQED